MKIKVTLKLDSELVREVRALAAEEGTSISGMFAAHLTQILRERKVYERARKRAVARLRRGMGLRWTPVRFRGEIHER